MPVRLKSTFKRTGQKKSVFASYDKNGNYFLNDESLNKSVQCVNKIERASLESTH